MKSVLMVSLLLPWRRFSGWGCRLCPCPYQGGITVAGLVEKVLSQAMIMN